MRRMQWLLGVTFGSAAVMVACGGSTNDGGPTPDASVADTSVPDTSVVDAADAADAAPVEDAAPCVTDGATIQSLNLPDAALNDAGTVTVGTCSACLQTTCATELDDCNKDCDCIGAADRLLTCVASGTPALSCAATISDGGLGNLDQAEQGFLLCIATSCKAPCGVPDFGGGGDASMPLDASEDAPSAD